MMRALYPKVVVLSTILLFFLASIPSSISMPAADDSADIVAESHSSARLQSITLTPEDGSVVTWYDHSRVEVEYEGESPDISSATGEVSSDLTGIISGSSLSLVGDTVRLSLPERDCDTGHGDEYNLCPMGEEISVDISGVLNESGAALPDQSWSFSVGTASINITSPAEGAYLNTTSPVLSFTTQNHAAQLTGQHIHYMYDEHGPPSKMHKSMDSIQYSGLPEGQVLLIVDLRSSEHEWLGHDEAIAAVTVTIDTVAPSIENEQLAPMVDANNVPVNTTVTVRFSEHVLDGATITVSSEAGEIVGQTSTNIAGSKSELIFTATSELEKGVLYTVNVDGVKDMAGNPMQAFSYAFTTVADEEEISEEGWLSAWGELTLGIGAIIVSLIGWMLLRRSRAKVRWYLSELERVVHDLGENVTELEQQINRMKKDVAEDYHKGRLDEKQYQLVEKKLEDASSEIRRTEAKEVLGSIPESLAAKLEQALADGHIDNEEVEQMLSQSSDLDSEQQSDLASMLKRWKDEDEEP